MRRFPFVGSLKRHARLFVACVLASTLLPISFPSQVALAEGAIETRDNLTNNDDQSESPQISFGGNQLGASWGEREATSVGTARAALDGNFGERVTLNTGSKTKQQWPDVAVDASGTIHLAYASGNTIFYRRKPVGGTWSNAVTVGGDSFPNPVRIAVAPNGTIWVVWRDGAGTKVGFKFSDNGGAGWSGGNAGGVVASETGNMYAPDIAIGPDNVPHVVWYLLTGGADKGEIKYADWNGSQFRAGKLTNDGSELYDADPVITVDKNNVQHLVFRKQVSSDGTAWGITYARRDPGGKWSNFTQLAVSSGDAKYSPGIGIDDSGSIYVGYSEPFGKTTSRQVVLLAKPAGQTNWTKQTISNGRWDYRPVIAGSSASGLKAHVLYQEEQQPDKGEIIYARVRFTSNTPKATPVLDAGAEYTRNNAATLTFSNVSGGATGVRWRWGAPPTDQANDSNGWQAGLDPRQVPLPVPDGGCGALTLYTQVRANASLLQQGSSSDSITYDDNVSADAGVFNPNTSNLTSSYAAGANAGASGYTRETAYNFVLNGTDDCGGLKSYKINTGPETAINGDSAFVARLPFGAQASGPKAVTVVVTDKAGNQRTYPESVQLDLPGDSRPVVRSATVRISGGNTLQQTITITNANVTDTQYSAGFWGVFVATSRTPVDNSEINASGLAWTPIRVPDPTANSFTVAYDVTSGLNANGLNGAVGDYYVYLKFIDGAGNASEWTSAALQVTLSAGYATPKTFAPVIATAR